MSFFWAPDFARHTKALVGFLIVLQSLNINAGPCSKLLAVSVYPGQSGTSLISVEDAKTLLNNALTELKLAQAKTKALSKEVHETNLVDVDRDNLVTWRTDGQNRFSSPNTPANPLDITVEVYTKEVSRYHTIRPEHYETGGNTTPSFSINTTKYHLLGQLSPPELTKQREQFFAALERCKGYHNPQKTLALVAGGATGIAASSILLWTSHASSTAQTTAYSGIGVVGVVAIVGGVTYQFVCKEADVAQLRKLVQTDLKNLDELIRVVETELDHLKNKRHMFDPSKSKNHGASPSPSTPAPNESHQ